MKKLISKCNREANLLGRPQFKEEITSDGVRQRPIEMTPYVRGNEMEQKSKQKHKGNLYSNCQNTEQVGVGGRVVGVLGCRRARPLRRTGRQR